MTLRKAFEADQIRRGTLHVMLERDPFDEYELWTVQSAIRKTVWNYVCRLLSGGLRRMVTLIALNSMNDTTRLINTKTEDAGFCLLGQGKRSSSVPPKETPCSYGEDSKTTVANTASTVQCSAMKADTSAANSYARRMRLLIASGLVAGITPTSTRKRSPQATLDFALSPQDGDDFLTAQRSAA